MDLDLSLGSVSCDTAKEGADGALAEGANYLMVAGPREVQVSSYMGSVMTAGSFGNMHVFEGAAEVEYEAVQLHLVAPSLHTINGQHYDAELMVMHKKKGAMDMLDQSLIVSVMLSNSDASAGFSSVVEALGFAKDGSDQTKGRTSWQGEGVLDLAGALQPALEGRAHSYNGSMPVPPCAETVKWVILAAPQAISPKQTDAIGALLLKARNGAEHRRPAKRTADRCVAVNSRQVGGGHRHPTCEADLMAGTWMRSAQCWEEQDRCWAKRYSAVDIDTTTATEPDAIHPEVDIKDMVHYKTTDSIEVSPSLYTLDAHVKNDGNFGHLKVAGHIFFARNVTFKAISQHVIDHKRAEGELVIEHVMYGDMYGHQNLPDFEVHKVMVSIPLALGAENSLLRKLNLNPSTSRSMADGLAYDVPLAVDLAEQLAPTLGGRWWWYSSNSTHRDCGLSVRWMVFETPLSISMEQLNLLNLPVSGVDSSHPPYPVPQGSFWRQHLPASAVEMNETECSNLRDPNWKYGDAAPHWDYGNERCWGDEFPICKAGQAQSPIDVPIDGFSTLGSDHFLNKCSWKPVEGLRVSNTGHNFQVSSKQFGYMQFINDIGMPDFYQVAQFHIHMPSEHLIGGKQYAAELHIVHAKQNTVLELASDDLLVTAIMFDFGEESQILRQLFLPNATGMTHEKEYKNMERPFDPMWAFGPVIDGPFFRYDGSLTTPPCSEVVKWFVFEKSLTISIEQWAAFKHMYPNPNNNRPVQPLHGRKIARNSFQEGTQVNYKFFLNREMGHDRSAVSPPHYIMFPIIGTLVLCFAVMAATFVRLEKRKQESAGGLTPGASVVGSPTTEYAKLNAER